MNTENISILKPIKDYRGFIITEEQYIEETRYDVKPSLWVRIKNSGLMKTLGYLFRIRIEEEKELSTFFIEDIKTQIESIDVQKEIIDNYCNRVLKKFFTRKQLEKIDEIIKSIKEGERI